MSNSSGWNSLQGYSPAAKSLSWLSWKQFAKIMLLWIIIISSASAGHAAGDLLPWTFPVSLAWCLMLGDDGQYLMTWCLILCAWCLMPQAWCLILVQCTTIIVRGTLVELGYANIQMVFVLQGKNICQATVTTSLSALKDLFYAYFDVCLRVSYPEYTPRGGVFFFSAKALASQPRQTHRAFWWISCNFKDFEWFPKIQILTFSVIKQV